KLSVVLIVIAVGAGYVARGHWTDIPYSERKLPVEIELKSAAAEHARAEQKLLDAAKEWSDQVGAKEDIDKVSVLTSKGRTRTLGSLQADEEARAKDLEA